MKYAPMDTDNTTGTPNTLPSEILTPDRRTRGKREHYYRRDRRKQTETVVRTVTDKKDGPLGKSDTETPQLTQNHTLGRGRMSRVALVLIWVSRVALLCPTHTSGGSGDRRRRDVKETNTKGKPETIPSLNPRPTHKPRVRSVARPNKGATDEMVNDYSVEGGQ